MQKLDFFKLSREKQERFLASAKGAAPPAPILARYGASGDSTVLFAASGGALAMLLVVLLVGFGSLASGLAVHHAPWLAVYAACAFLIPFGILRAVGLAREAKSLPFRAGWYAFPMTLVDARQKVLRVYPMADLVKAEPGPGGFLLTVKGAGTLAFPLGEGESGAQLSQQIEIAQANLKHALASQDESELVTLDPFFEAKKGWTSPIGPKEALSEQTPLAKRLAPIAAIASALVLAPLFWSARNAASEDSMLAKAKAADTPEAYTQYLALGDRHADDVSRVLLPRAELARAKAARSVEAIQAFLASHPGSAIDVEAQAALREAYARELDLAKQANTVTALAAFATRYPQHGMQAELTKANHALYAAALDRFKKQAATDDPALVAFVARLLAYLEAHGPKVRVAVARDTSPGLERADKILGESPLNRGRGTRQVTRWFDGAPAGSADDAAKALAPTFARVFPPDILTLVPASTPEEASSDPSIVVRLRVAWLGPAYISGSLKRTFAAVNVSGDGVVALPADPSPLRAKVDVAPAKDLPLSFASSSHPALASTRANPDAPEQGVYTAQEVRALDAALTTVEHTLFKDAP